MAGEATSSFRATGREAEELESPPGATDTPKALPDGSGLHWRHRHQGGSAADVPIPTDATNKNLASAARGSLKKTEVGLLGCDFTCLAACWENKAAARGTRQGCHGEHPWRAKELVNAPEQPPGSTTTAHLLQRARRKARTRDLSGLTMAFWVCLRAKKAVHWLWKHSQTPTKDEKNLQGVQRRSQQDAGSGRTESGQPHGEQGKGPSDTCTASRSTGTKQRLCPREHPHHGCR